MRFCRVWILGIMFLGVAVFATPVDTAVAVKVHAPGSMFTKKEPLRFTLKEDVAMPLKWHLLDWQDHELRSGDWPDGGKGELVLEALPNGYYKLTVESTQATFEGFRSFAVVPDPASRHRNPNTFFALDSGQSWTARARPENTIHPDNAFELVSEVAYRCGVEVVRERMSWHTCEYAPGKFNWNPEKRPYKLNADMLSQRGIAISGMYYGAPKWAAGSSSLPSDLVSTYNYARELAKEFKGQMVDWEFWNEQDLGSKPRPVWEYVSALKAAYLGFKAGDPELQVTIGGFAQCKVNDLQYAHVAMQNGAGDYFDIFNVHSYSSIWDYPNIVDNINLFLKRYGLEKRPIWFTEIGTDAEGSGRIKGYVKGWMEHSPEQEMLLAEILPKTMIRMQSLGVDRNFFFLLCPYNERNGNKAWGLMRQDYTIKPALVSYSTLTSELTDAEYLGTVELGQGIAGFLYARPDGSQSLVYWSLSTFDTESNQPNRKFDNLLERKFSLPISSGTYQGVNIFGTSFEVKASSGKLELTAIRLPAILTGLAGLKPTVPFKPVAKSGMGESKYDRTIVFRVEMGNDFTLSPGKDYVSIKKDSGKFKLQVWNLSDKEKSGTLAISGGTITEVPKSVTVSPFSKVEYELSFTPELDKKYRGELRIGGTFGGKPVSELVVPVRIIDKQAENARKVEIVGIDDPINFKKNSSGKMQISYDEQEKAVKFDTVFPAKNNGLWVYPVYTLQLPQDSLGGAIGLTFEVKVVTPKPISQFLVMAVVGKGLNAPNGSDSYYLKTDLPTDQWETRTVLFPDNLDPSLVKQLRIGLNPKADTVTYWIRNFRILFPN